MSRRNNEDRIGANQTAAASPPVDTTETTTPGTLDFTTPVEFVELPSQGKFYPEGHPLHNKETVEIRHMTAKDEDILTSKSLLKKGLAIDRLLQNVMTDKAIKPDQLLVGDKNAIIIAARQTGYGSEYETNVSCPVCANTSRHEFNLALAEINGPDNCAAHGAELTDNGTLLITLPKSNVVVEAKMLTGRDEAALVKMQQTKSKHGAGEHNLTSQFKMFIESVNGHTDRGTISKFVDNMPATDSRHLRTVYGKSVPNVDLTQKFFCEECLTETTMEVPLTAGFFWPK